MKFKLSTAVLWLLITSFLVFSAGFIAGRQKVVCDAKKITYKIMQVSEARNKKFQVFRIKNEWSDSDRRSGRNTGINLQRASWYSSADACGKKTNRLKGCPTASGASLYVLERKRKLFCAVPRGAYKLGKRLKVINISNGASVKVAVLDTGGFRKYGRAIDLSKAAFKKLAPLGQGIINVKIEEIK